MIFNGKIFLELKNVTNNTQNKWKIDQTQEKKKKCSTYSKLKLSFSYIQPKLNTQPKYNNNIHSTSHINSQYSIFFTAATNISALSL